MPRLSELRLPVRALAFACAGFMQGVPGKRFDVFGRKLGFRILWDTHKFHPLILNPVSSVRYFEFDFVESALPCAIPHTRILDVSSPYLFGFYIATKHDVEYEYVNPDLREREEIQRIRKYCSFRGEYKFAKQDATCLSYEDETFDHVISISVIEHINGQGDSAAMQEFWRILRPGGALILTFPVKNMFEEEFRDQNVYQLPVDMRDGQFFFQRYYDEETIVQRLLSVLDDYVVLGRAIYGEIDAGFFSCYERRWIKEGLDETIKDPLLMASKMQRFGKIEQLPGVGVFGITIVKKHKNR